MRRLVLTAGLAVVLGGCGSAAQTAKNPQPTSSFPTRVYQTNVGDAVVLTGVDDASGTGTLKLAVKADKVVSTATGRGAFENPRKGERFAAVRFVFTNVGTTPYHDSPTFGAKVIDATGHGYDPTVATVSAGPGFSRVVTMRRGQTRTGYIVFAVPKDARIVRVEYALNAGYGPELGKWLVSQGSVGQATALRMPPHRHCPGMVTPRPTRARAPRPPRRTRRPWGR